MKDSVVQVIKVIVIDVVFTLVSILLLSFLAYKFKIGDNVIRIGIVIVYAVSNLVGGFVIGKIKENKKYIWGAVTGIIYFIILTVVSVLATGQLYGNENMAVMAFVASVIGGSVGGMIS